MRKNPGLTMVVVMPKFTIAGQEQPPRRFIAGTDSIAIAEQKAKDLQEQANAFRALSTSLAREDA